MKLRFKQRFFSWLDSYDVYNENGEVVFRVEGQIAFGHCLHIIDQLGNHIATVKQEILTFMPRFDLYLGENYLGSIKKEFSFLVPRYDIAFKNWYVEGDFLEWDYTIYDGVGNPIGTVNKELFNFTDTYSIDYSSADNGIYLLMLVLAIDAEKCSRN